ncbi:hypothetical protein HID58_026712, partial [Brassica napus]
LSSTSVFFFSSLYSGFFGYLCNLHCCCCISSASTHCNALAAEMAPDTRVNVVAPGVVPPTHFASFITQNSEVRRNFSGRRRNALQALNQNLPLVT